MSILDGLKDLRLTSKVQKDGYCWDSGRLEWVETDAKFRQRMRIESVWQNVKPCDSVIH